MQISDVAINVPRPLLESGGSKADISDVNNMDDLESLLSMTIFHEVTCAYSFYWPSD